MSTVSDFTRKWWVQAATPVLNKRPRNKAIIGAIYNLAEVKGYSTEGLNILLKQLSPRKSKVNKEEIAYYDNSYKYAHDKLTRTNPGRFLKKVFPEADDKSVEGFSTYYSSEIAVDSSDYILSIGTTREEFKNAFVNYVRGKPFDRDYNTTKCIFDSCMRGSFSSLGCHPAEVYASGDFEVVTVLNKRGKTRARCVVRIKQFNGEPCYNQGYIYASDALSADMITEYLQSKGAIHEEWNEARILNIRLDKLRIVCPYIDNNRYVMMLDNEYNVIFNKPPRSYTWNFNSTSGWVGNISVCDKLRTYVPNKKGCRNYH